MFKYYLHIFVINTVIGPYNVVVLNFNVIQKKRDQRAIEKTKALREYQQVGSCYNSKFRNYKGILKIFQTS